MKTVFLDAETFNIALEAPKRVADWQVYDFTEQNDSVIATRLANANIAVVNKVQLSRDLLATLPDLKLIQITATGMNNVDLDACKAFGITCLNVSGYAKQTVAEHTFALLLNLTRNISYFHQSVKAGDWSTSRQFCLIDRQNIDLNGKTIGIIGYGTTGKRVAEIARVFGMNVLIAEHQGRPPRNPDYTVFEKVLSESDVLSLHCPLTPATKALINTNTLALMDKHPILLNLARGGVIDEEAVANAIMSGQLSGFATDVLSSEPPLCSNPILSIMSQANVVVSPHNAWASTEAQQTLWKKACEQIDSFVIKNNTLSK